MSKESQQELLSLGEREREKIKTKGDRIELLE